MLNILIGLTLFAVGLGAFYHAMKADLHATANDETVPAFITKLYGGGAVSVIISLLFL
jgi:hypothetical protein